MPTVFHLPSSCFILLLLWTKVTESGEEWPLMTIDGNQYKRPNWSIVMQYRYFCPEIPFKISRVSWGRTWETALWRRTRERTREVSTMREVSGGETTGKTMAQDKWWLSMAFIGHAQISALRRTRKNTCLYTTRSKYKQENRTLSFEKAVYRFANRCNEGPVLASPRSKNARGKIWHDGDRRQHLCKVGGFVLGSQDWSKSSDPWISASVQYFLSPQTYSVFSDGRTNDVSPIPVIGASRPSLESARHKPATLWA